MPPSFGKVKGRSDPQLVAAQARLREAVAATPASRTLGQQQHQELALHLSEDGDLLDAVNEKLARLRLPKVSRDGATVAQRCGLLIAGRALSDHKARFRSDVPPHTYGRVSIFDLQRL